MPQQSQQQRHDSSDDADAIQRDIHQTRERIDETLEAVEAQLSPGELINQVVSFFRHSEASNKVGSKASELMSGLARTVKENPVPMALIGVGLLSLARDGGPSTSDVKRAAARGKRRASELGDRAQEAASKLGDKIQDLGEGAGEGADGPAEGARELAGEATDKAREIVGEARESVEQGYERVRERIADDPIVLGALGIALGAALGAGVPSTRREDEAFGEQRDQLLSKAREVGEELREGAKEGAGVAATSTSEPGFA